MQALTVENIDNPVIAHDKQRRAITYTWERPDVPSVHPGGTRVVELVTYWHKGAKTYSAFLCLYDRYTWGTSTQSGGWGTLVKEAPVPRHSVKAQRKFAEQAVADVLYRLHDGDPQVTALLSGQPYST